MIRQPQLLSAPMKQKKKKTERYICYTFQEDFCPLNPAKLTSYISEWSYSKPGITGS